jgi:parvulin-like peptidyl-prolyl isomerase
MKFIRKSMTWVTAVIVFGISLALANSKELAKVNDYAISDNDFQQRVALLSLKARPSSDAEKEKFLNKMIDEELLVREAEKVNIQEKEDYKRRVEIFRREFLVTLYMDQFLREKGTEASQKEYYEKNKERYKGPEMVKLSIIRLKSEEEAKDIFKRVSEEEDFAELAKKYSQAPGAQNGGDLGFREKRGLRKEFADVAFSMKKGEIKGPIKTSDGYYIIKLTDHREEGIAEFEMVKRRVFNDYAKKITEEKISDLRKAAKIQINSAELSNLNIK